LKVAGKVTLAANEARERKTRKPEKKMAKRGSGSSGIRAEGRGRSWKNVFAIGGSRKNDPRTNRFAKNSS